MAVMSWFGWSVLWTLPLVWRLVKVFVLKRTSLLGQGFIRLVLGTMLVALTELVICVQFIKSVDFADARCDPNT